MKNPVRENPEHWSARLPFYYGWLIVGIAFVTMAIGVTARTAFSLLMPPLINEFGWDRGLTAGAFSFGFLVSAVLGPIVGRVMDARGPRIVIMTGVLLMASGLFLARYIERPWHLYATLGVLVGGGTNLIDLMKAGVAGGAEVGELVQDHEVHHPELAGELEVGLNPLAKARVLDDLPRLVGDVDQSLPAGALGGAREQ